MSAIIFLSSVLGILAISHSFLYFSWIHFFDIGVWKTKVLIIAGLSLLSISFVLASMLLHFSSNIVFKAYYTLSGIWLGLVVYLSAASIIVWILRGAAWVIPSLPAGRISFAAAAILYSAAVFYTGLSYANTFHVHTTRISVPIKNLPPQWIGKTIVQISDLHLGGVRGESFLMKIVKTVNALQPDIIAITGDLFDGMSGLQESYIAALRLFKAKTGVFFVSGNHEVYAGVEHANMVVGQSGIQVIDNKILDLDGLQLIGIGCPHFRRNKGPGFDIASHPDYKPDQPSVVLFHTPTDIGDRIGNPAASHSRAYFAPKTNFDTGRKLGISLQLSGHTHAGQFIPFTWVAKSIFNNYHYGLHKNGDFYIYVTSGTGTWGPPLRSGSASEIAVITLEKAEKPDGE